MSKYLKTVHFHELSQRCQPSHGWTIIHISLPTLVDKWDGWMCRTKEAERQFCKKRAGGDGPARQPIAVSDISVYICLIDIRSIQKQIQRTTE